VVAGIMKMRNDNAKYTTLQDSLEESEEIIYNVVEEVLRKTGIDPKEVPPTPCGQCVGIFNFLPSHVYPPPPITAVLPS